MRASSDDTTGESHTSGGARRSAAPPSLNFLVLVDAGSIHLNFNKVKLINARDASRSLVATFDRRFFISATMLSLPRLTSLRVCAGAAKLFFVLGGRLSSLGGNLQVVSPTTALYRGHQHIRVLRGGIAVIPFLPLFPLFGLLVLADTP
jgi:hypothetical protein